MFFLSPIFFSPIITGYFSRNFKWAFVPIDKINVCTKFVFHSFTRPGDNRGYPKRMGSPWIRPRSLFSKIFDGLLLRWILWMYWPNVNSVPEIIGGTRKNWTVPGYAHAPFTQKFLLGFCLDGPSECTGVRSNLKSIALHVPGIMGGTQKFWAVPGYAHASFSPKFFMGFY